MWGLGGSHTPGPGSALSTQQLAPEPGTPQMRQRSYVKCHACSVARKLQCSAPPPPAGALGHLPVRQVGNGPACRPNSHRFHANESSAFSSSGLCMPRPAACRLLGFSLHFQKWTAVAFAAVSQQVNPPAHCSRTPRCRLCGTTALGASTPSGVRAPVPATLLPTQLPGSALGSGMCWPLHPYRGPGGAPGLGLAQPQLSQPSGE